MGELMSGFPVISFFHFLFGNFFFGYLKQYLIKLLYKDAPAIGSAVGLTYVSFVVSYLFATFISQKIGINLNIEKNYSSENYRTYILIYVLLLFVFSCIAEFFGYLFFFKQYERKIAVAAKYSLISNAAVYLLVFFLYLAFH